ncbi:MAG: 7-carboxy-7-deazaguanine synthase QueE [Bacteroidales bacterium]|nr:7-carboxy-7-deazaguanine synthase QueE [Bacteroidales bacterium]
MMVGRLIEWGRPLDASWGVADASASAYLNVAECFYDTIQGEGASLGVPAAFLRLGGCPLGCKFCDTEKVWKQAVKVSVEALVEHILSCDMAKRLSDGQHLVVTGGSPLLQQDSLIVLLSRLRKAIPNLYVEIENECSIVPSKTLCALVNQWNNSPKLSNSGVPKSKRYNPQAIKALEGENCYYKFVVNGENDWDEIQSDFIATGLVKRQQVILMPMGGTFEEYAANREKTVELAIEHGVRYSPREHIAIWNDKKGI